MRCTNCGDGETVEGYTLRFTLARDDTRELDLELCSECVDGFRDEDGIEVG